MDFIVVNVPKNSIQFCFALYVQFSFVPSVVDAFHLLFVSASGFSRNACIFSQWQSITERDALI